jgi:hypothetical protein
LIAPAPTTTLPPPGPELAGSGSPTPTPTPTPSTQHSVDADEPCTPEGGAGLTDDGVTLRCERAGDELRWRVI